MNYFWGTCAACGCQVTINFAEAPDRLTGSLRRWSTDRTVNDGRKMEVPRAGVGPGRELPDSVRLRRRGRGRGSGDRARDDGTL